MKAANWPPAANPAANPAAASLNPWQWWLGAQGVWWSWQDELLSPLSSLPCPAMQLWMKWFGNMGSFHYCLVGAQLWDPSALWDTEISQTWPSAFCRVGGAGGKAFSTDLLKGAIKTKHSRQDLRSPAVSAIRSEGWGVSLYINSAAGSSCRALQSSGWQSCCPRDLLGFTRLPLDLGTLHFPA